MKKVSKMLWTCLVFQLVLVSTLAKTLSDKKCCLVNEYLIERKTGIQCGVPNKTKNLLEMPFIDDQTIKQKKQSNLLFCKQNNTNSNCTDLYVSDELSSMSHVAINCTSHENKTSFNVLTVVNSKNKFQNSSDYFVNICCPSNQVYNNKTKSCIEENKNLSGLVQVLSNQTDFVHFRRPDIYKCQTALTDHRFSQFTIKNNILRIGDSKKYQVDLSKNETNWCIDKTSVKKAEFVFQLCENANYCNSHFCLKKCSKFDENLKLNEYDEYDRSPMEVSFFDALRKTNSTKFLRLKSLVFSSKDMGFKPFLNCKYGYENIIPSWEITPLGHLRYIVRNNILRNDDFCIDAVINHDDEIDIKVFTCFNINAQSTRGFNIFDYRTVLITLGFFGVGIVVAILIFDSFLMKRATTTSF